MKDEKILNEEVLSEEELEGVAGGSLSAMVKDTKFLHALGLMDRAYSAKEIKANEYEIGLLINEAFGSQGMWAEAYISGKHSYGGEGISDGSGISRAQAYKELANRVKPGFNYKKYL